MTSSSRECREVWVVVRVLWFWVKRVTASSKQERKGYEHECCRPWEGSMKALSGKQGNIPELEAMNHPLENKYKKLEYLNFSLPSS